MATVEEVGKDLISMVGEAKFDEATAKYYSPNIVSTEAFGDPATVTGIDAVNAKSQWWMGNFEVHGIEVDGPFVCGNQFIAEYKMDVTNKKSSERSTMHETALYTVEDGKIIEEKFFYGLQMM